MVSSLALLALFGCGGMSAEDNSPEAGANRVRTSEKDTKASERAHEDGADEGTGADGADEGTGADGADEGTGADGADEEATGQGKAAPPEAIAAAEPVQVEPEPPAVAPEATAGRGATDAIIEVPDDETTDGEQAPDFELEIVDDLSVLVIFDNSGSMDGYWDGSSRWTVANRALHDAFAPVATSLKVAAIRFPIEGECGVPDFSDEVHFGWQLAGEFLEEWEANAVPPVGGTPMGRAFLAADEAIAQAKEQGLLEARFNVILLTDGEPNCETDTGLLTTLPAYWSEMGVKTHVLGLPGSSAAADLLNQIAVAGGTGEFVALGDASPDQLVHEVTAASR